jgi:nicotinamidase/pyrazinamidase
VKQRATKKIHLVVIDPQHDFCDPSGALFVGGADDDMKVRLPAMVRRLKGVLDDIHITLDSHHLVHVAHPIFWRDTRGKHPHPFTIISAEDVKNGVWTTTIPSMHARGEAYVKSLADHGRYPLCIWPPHCEIGSMGHTVVPELWNAVREWEAETFAAVDYVTKGSNVYTEHYSALMADVPDPADPSTQINAELIRTLMTADEIVIAGEALSHCLANTVTDLADNFGDDDHIKKLVLLTDASSSVTGFEAMGTEFIDRMTKRGMRLSTTTEYMS